MITSKTLRRYIYDQVRYTLLAMHEDHIVYISNCTEGDLIIDKAYQALLTEFNDNRIPTTQDVNKAITRAYLEMYAEEFIEDIEEEPRFNLKPEDFAEVRK